MKEVVVPGVRVGAPTAVYDGRGAAGLTVELISVQPMYSPNVPLMA